MSGIFKEVDIADIPGASGGTTGRVSFPLISAFMDSGLKAAEIDPTVIDYDKPIKALQSNLRYYARVHRLPLVCHLIDGTLYLIRSDLNDGFTPEWQVKEEKQAAKKAAREQLNAALNKEPVRLTPEEITVNAAKQRGSAVR